MMKPGAYLSVAAAGLAFVAFLVFWADKRGDAVLQVPADTEGAVPWTSTEVRDDPELFRFLVVSDRTGGHRQGVFAEVMEKINLLEPDFVVSVGDLIEGYTEDEATLQYEWEELESYIARLEMPFFYVAGNHDMSNEIMAEEWQGRFGPSYYYFRYKDVLFLVLNSELFGMSHNPQQPLPGPWTLAEQMSYAEQALAEHADARWTVVLLHQPLWDEEEHIHPEWLRFEQMLQGRKHTVFAGHYHRYTLHRRNNANYITLATTGGGSPLRGTAWGEFDQVALVHMGADGPRIANLETQGIHDVSVRTAAQRDIAAALDDAVRVISSPAARPAQRTHEAEYEIVNPLQVPLHWRADFSGGRDYLLEDHHRSGRLEAGERTSVRATASAFGAVFAGNASPIKGVFSFEVQSERSGEPPLRLDVERLWQPEYLFRVERAGDIVVDGRGDDWQQLPYGSGVGEQVVTGPGQHGGSDDLSFRFNARADEEFLYLFVSVTDDSLVSLPQRIARYQDMVQIALDSRPEAELMKNYPSLEAAVIQGVVAQVILPMIPVGESLPDTALALFGVQPVEGMQKAVRRTERGYAVELAIPVESLNQRSGGQWQQMRLNISVTDYDADESDFTQVYWRLPRYAGGTVAEGAGRFEAP